MFPPLGAALGPRPVGIASVLASSVLFAHLARRHFDRGRALAVAWFAVVAAGDLFIGRLTFALGVAFALACVAALSHRSHPAAVALGVATAAASPVTALLLVVVLLPAGLRSIAPRWRLVVLGAPHGRVEVVPTSTRRESVFVAPHVALARGWQTQLDARYNGLFSRPELDPAEYERWLRRLGITHVALSDGPKERWGEAEERLLSDPPPT